MEVEINGVKYRSKEATEGKSKRLPMSKTMMSLMVMAGMAQSFGMYGEVGTKEKKEKETPDVNIIKEYGLIQQKKSRLSKSQRDWVVWQFEKNFERITS